MKTQIFNDPVFNVEHWRERLAAIKPDLPRNWKVQLLQQNPSLDSLQGATIIQSVMAGRGSLTNTAGIVEILEQLVKKSHRGGRQAAGLTPAERMAARK